MEKLISADKFYREIDTLADEAKFDRLALHFSTEDVLMNIMCQQEVDAIPVKWITQRLKDLPPSYQEFAIKLINEYEMAKKEDSYGR